MCLANGGFCFRKTTDWNPKNFFDFGVWDYLLLCQIRPGLHIPPFLPRDPTINAKAKMSRKSLKLNKIDVRSFSEIQKERCGRASQTIPARDLNPASTSALKHVSAPVWQGTQSVYRSQHSQQLGLLLCRAIQSSTVSVEPQ